MSIARISSTSTVVTFSSGAGSVRLMPGDSVRLYLPNSVTTPRSCGPTRWKQVRTSHSTIRIPIAAGQSVLPAGRGGRLPNPPPPPPWPKLSRLRRSSSSMADGPLPPGERPGCVQGLRGPPSPPLPEPSLPSGPSFLPPQGPWTIAFAMPGIHPKNLLIPSL